MLQPVTGDKEQWRDPWSRCHPAAARQPDCRKLGACARLPPPQAVATHTQGQRGCNAATFILTSFWHRSVCSSHCKSAWTQSFFPVFSVFRHTSVRLWYCQGCCQPPPPASCCGGLQLLHISQFVTFPGIREALRLVVQQVHEPRVRTGTPLTGLLSEVPRAPTKWDKYDLFHDALKLSADGQPVRAQSFYRCVTCTLAVAISHYCTSYAAVPSCACFPQDACGFRLPSRCSHAGLCPLLVAFLRLRSGWLTACVMPCAGQRGLQSCADAARRGAATRCRSQRLPRLAFARHDRLRCACARGNQI